MELAFIWNSLPEIPFDHYLCIYKIRYHGSKFPFEPTGEISINELLVSDSVPFYMKYSKEPIKENSSIMLATVTFSYNHEDKFSFESKIPKIHGDLLLKYARGVLTCSAQGTKDSVLPITMLFSSSGKIGFPCIEEYEKYKLACTKSLLVNNYTDGGEYPCSKHSDSDEIDEIDEISRFIASLMSSIKPKPVPSQSQSITHHHRAELDKTVPERDCSSGLGKTVSDGLITGTTNTKSLKNKQKKKEMRSGL